MELTFLPRFARDGAMGLTGSDVGTLALDFGSFFFRWPSGSRSGRIARPICASCWRDPPFPRLSRAANALIPLFSEYSR